MSHSIPISHDAVAKRIGLTVWMERVLLKAEEARQGWSANAVHDLRVALRRCRTMAEALGEVNPGPGWRKLKKSSRALFHNLGVLRDTQVKKEWVKKLGAPDDPIRKNLLRVLSSEERKHRNARGLGRELPPRDAAGIGEGRRVGGPEDLCRERCEGEGGASALRDRRREDRGRQGEDRGAVAYPPCARR